MHKIAILLLVCTVLAVAKGDLDVGLALRSDNKLADRTDNFINLNRVQYARIMEDFDTKLNNFKEYYDGRVQGVNVQLDMVTASIVQTEERLNPLEVLNDFSKQCATKYRYSIPTVATAKASITRCVTDATSQITNLLNTPLSTKNSLQNYYLNYFEKEITNCGKTFTNTTSNYTACVTTVTTNTNSYTISSQKNFATQMEAAECTGKAYIKRALDCSYTVQTNTISKISEANILINNCLIGKDECKPCDERNTCLNSIEFKVDYENKTITNPFYGLQKQGRCLLLRLY